MKALLGKYFTRLGLLAGGLGIAICAGVIVPGYLSLRAGNQELDHLKQQLQTLEQFRLQGNYEQSLEELQQRQEGLNQVLREQVDMSSLGEGLQQQAHNSGVRVKELRKLEALGEKKSTGKLRKHTVELLVSGEYDKLLGFLKLLEERQLQPENLRLTGQKEGREILLDCRISIYELAYSNT